MSNIKKILHCIKENIWGAVLRTATCISPELNTRLLYYKSKHRLPNLNEPKTFHEKLLFLKLKNYNFNPLVVECADKYAVRDYVKRHGCKECLNELIAVYDDAEDIIWDDLPDSFVLKWNFGASYNIICSDKNTLDINDATKKLKKWGGKKYWLGGSEMQYKYCKKKIVCEKFLKTIHGEAPEDYKLYCFNGKVKAILYISGRGSECKRGGFFSTNWEYLGKASDYYHDFQIIPPRPKSLEEMVRIAEKLTGVEFPFVRVDFYDHDGKAIFGEMTFTPGSGVVTAEIDIDGKSMGELLQL